MGRYQRLSEIVKDSDVAHENVQTLRFWGNATCGFALFVIALGLLKFLLTSDYAYGGPAILLSCGFMVCVFGMHQIDRAEIIEALISLKEQSKKVDKAPG